MKELITIESVSENALEVFTGKTDTLDKILLAIEAEALALVPDVSTVKGRDAISSNAYKVAQAKSRIEKEGKILADQQKEIPKLIDASRKKARYFLEELQSRVKQPLTDWLAEEARVKAEKEEAERVEAERVEAEKQYQDAHELALLLNLKFDTDKAAAAVEAEKAQLAKEAAEREAKEREAKERAEREALIAKEAKERAEREAKEAIERANREAEQAKQREKQAAELAEKQRLEAIELAEREKQAAIEADRRRAEAEREAKEAKEKAEAAKLSHRRKINNEIKSLLVDFGLDDETATNLIKLAVKGKLGNLTVNY
jgi:hypothetical protein